MLTLRIPAVLLLAAWLAPAVVSGQAIGQDQLEFFEKKIRPVLVQHCYSCHAKDAKAIKGGLVLDTREGIRRGGDSGHAVVPGELESSLLMEAIRYESFEMPPTQPLPESVIADFETWIEMGAPDPREGPSLIKREIDFEEARSHWAYQPVQPVTPPEPANPGWARSEIDRFIEAQLESRQLKPVADANRATLVRRLHYDLTGLPPTPEELDAAVADDSPRAIAQLVDRLLASPQFGERWGRHWLDVVRYAESNGRERNHVYPHAWRYRDYVIAAFNSDKPFNQFIREQIAGDLLEDAGNEQSVATGFLAIGPKLLNERNREMFVMDIVDEQIDVSTRAFMSLTVSCARCHDHKFDPIPTREYYSMAGIFRSTQTLFGTIKQQGNRQSSELISLVSTNRGRQKLAEAEAKQKAETEQALKAARRKLTQLQKQTQELAQQKNKPGAKKKAAESRRAIARVRKQVQSLQTTLNQFEGSGGDKAMGVREGKVADSPIYIRGETTSPKGHAPRGLLTILDPELQQPILETAQSGRLELANWIADRNNPLTTRVIANRIWRHLFGRGLVSTVDNFGATGEIPTHPALLDFLANRFADNGWSTKKLIREIVLSRTYQLAGQFEAENYAADPDNRFLWRHSPRRLEAESIRDTILLASGNLKLEPAAGSPVAQLKGEYGRNNVALNKQSLLGNFHRSVYLPIVRNAVPDSLKLFDFAEPSILVGDRAVTTVPTQALFFLNSDFVTAQCDDLAGHLLADGALTDSDRVDLAYRRVLSRNATANEIKRAQSYLSQTMEQLRSAVNATQAREFAWSGLCQALIGSAEFRYIE